MAAAEYYNQNGGGGPVQNPASVPQFAPPPSRPQSYQQSSHSQQSQPSHLPYPISDAPPPYTPYDVDSRAHSQPPPQNRVRFENENRPPGSILRPSHQSPNSSRPPIQQGYISSDKLRPPPGPFSVNPGAYQPLHGKAVQQPYQQPYFQPPPTNLAPQQGYLDPHAYRPAQQPYYPHERSRSRSRSRSHDRRYSSSSTTSRHSHGHHHHRRDEDRDRDRGTKKKGSSVTTFLGAGGGALIGDAIFPGLGTIGGAILGGLGGHEYDKQKREYTREGRMSRRAHSTAEIPEYYDKDDGRGRRY